MKIDSRLLRVSSLSLACGALLFGAAACSNSSDSAAAAPASASNAPAAAKPAEKAAEKPKDVSITGVHTGLGKGEYNHVAKEQNVFAPKDKIMVSVYSDGWAKKANIDVRWLNAKGEVLADEPRDVEYQGSLATLFEYRGATELPAGKYTIEVRLNGWLADHANFEVR